MSHFITLKMKLVIWFKSVMKLFLLTLCCPKMLSLYPSSVGWRSQTCHCSWYDLPKSCRCIVLAALWSVFGILLSKLKESNSKEKLMMSRKSLTFFYRICQRKCTQFDKSYFRKLRQGRPEKGTVRCGRRAMRFGVKSISKGYLIIYKIYNSANSAHFGSFLGPALYMRFTTAPFLAHFLDSSIRDLLLRPFWLISLTLLYGVYEIYYCAHFGSFFGP